MKSYISQAEIEELCEALVMQCYGKDVSLLQCVDIEKVITEVLGCRIEFVSFAEDDPDKIGFAGDGRTPLVVYKNDTVQSVIYPRNTIVLDRYLLQAREENRRRFVLGHEAGHIIVSQLDPTSAACFHREYDHERVYTVSDLQARYGIGEWQANTFASALLMPRFLMKEMLLLYHNGEPIPVYGEAVFHPREKLLLHKMSERLKVSFTALVIRLKNLGMLNHFGISEYISNEWRPGEIGAGDPL